MTLCLPVFALSGCSSDTSGTGDDETAGSETATETGDDPTAGDGDGDPTTGDGDGDPTTGDGDGDTCPVGSEGCPCTVGGGCDPGLACEIGICEPDNTTGDGDGDPTGDGDGDPTGDGDGDPTTGDGDGDPGGACAGDESFELLATDAADVDGWDEVESMLELGATVLAWDNQTQDASITWNIDVPCDDTWHIWVRAINNGQNDSFFALVDGAPEPAPIFEIACDQGPMQAQYQWRELNWRDQDAPGCEYVQDPWTQDWTTGAHTFTLAYRESYAVARLWITNTDQPPP